MTTANAILKRAVVAAAATALVLLVLGVAFHRSPGTPSGADPLDPEQIAKGKAVYERACASCHGARLEGQPDWRTPLPTGGYPASPHDHTGHTWHHPDALLFEITKHGGQSVAPEGFKSNMPAFADSLSDEEIWASLAYIMSRWPADVSRKQEHIDGASARARNDDR